MSSADLGTFRWSDSQKLLLFGNQIQEFLAEGHVCAVTGEAEYNVALSCALILVEGTSMRDLKRVRDQLPRIC